MSMDYLMGIDVGSSSVKAMIIDGEGSLAALGKSDGHDISCPQGGWAEQNPEDWWRGCCQAVQRALAAFGRPAGDIRAVGMSGQMHTLVPLDGDWRVLRPAIMHCDARSGREAKCIAERLGQDMVDGVVKNAIFPGLTLTSLVWVREHEPDIYARIRHILLPSGYLRLRLTGNGGIDYSDASATLAYDFAGKTWSKAVLDRVGIEADMFPDICASEDVAGRVTAAAAAETGLAEGTPVAFGGGDQVMQSVGSGCIAPGQATVNIGSGGQVCIQTEGSFASPRSGVNSFCGYGADRWYLMGANSNGGSAFKWFSHEILLERDYDVINAQVAKIAPGSDGLLFLPYLSGERCPLLNPDISGVFWGLSLLTDRGRMARAVMEGITFSLYDCLLACARLVPMPRQLVALGGGTNSAPWLQIQADVFGLPLITTRSKEQAVLGAAITAGVGCGVFSSFVEGCEKAVRYGDTYQPDPRAHEAYVKYFEVYREIYAQAGSALEKVTRLGRGGM